MRALIVDQGEASLRTDLPSPSRREGWSRVRVSIAGVCATDLALLRGYMDFHGIPGHEFVGIALEGPLEGRRVVGEINAACGQCGWCQRDLGRHCPRRSVLGIAQLAGCFADEISLPDANLLAVPNGVSNEAAVFTEPLAAAYEIAEQLPLQSGMRGLVVGDGRLGLLCVHVLHQHGVDVTLVGHHPERKRLLPFEFEFHGPEFLLTSSATRQFDLAVEATGHPDVLPKVIPFVRPRGAVVLKTTNESQTAIDLAPIVVNELNLIGSRCGRFAPALETLARGDLDLLPFVEARFPLERAVDALDHARGRGVLKVLIDINPPD